MIWPRWNIQELSAAIATLAVSFAVFGVEWTAFGTVFLVPMAFARAGWRLPVAAWSMAAGPPALYVLARYFVWAILCYRAGGRSLINQHYLRSVHDWGAVRVAMSTIELAGVGIAISIPYSVGIAWIRALRSCRAHRPIGPALMPGLALPFLWFLGVLMLSWGPREMADWFWD